MPPILKRTGKKNPQKIDSENASENPVSISHAAKTVKIRKKHPTHTTHTTHTRLTYLPQFFCIYTFLRAF